MTNSVNLFNVPTFSLNGDRAMYLTREDALAHAHAGDRLHTNCNGYTIASEYV